MTVVVAYDVSEDQRRARLAGLLQRYGDRIQQSVFLMTLPGDDLDDLIARCRDLVDAETDSVYVLRQCATCWDDVRCIGQAQPPTPQLFWAVL